MSRARSFLRALVAGIRLARANAEAAAIDRNFDARRRLDPAAVAELDARIEKLLAEEPAPPRRSGRIVTRFLVRCPLCVFRARAWAYGVSEPAAKACPSCGRAQLEIKPVFRVFEAASG